jgi:hypothetical protein
MSHLDQIATYLHESDQAYQDKKTQKTKLKAAQILSSKLKLGIPNRFINNQDDPFQELNKLIFENETISERYENLYGKRKVVFDSSDERVFVISKLSDVFNKYISRENNPSFSEITSNRVNEMLQKYKNYVKFDYNVALIHINQTNDTIYVSATDSIIEQIYVPYICIPSMTGHGSVVIPIKYFVENKLYG